nr:MAG TPA_asm: hypothetical protein [Caudoviricetes sp.]
MANCNRQNKCPANKQRWAFFLSTGTDALPRWLLLSNQSQKENHHV